MWKLSNLLAFLGVNAPTKKQSMGTKRRPTGTSLRNPADPVQAARIEAAAAKRGRKAAHRAYCAAQSIRFNKAHQGLADGIRRANPFYVATGNVVITPKNTAK